MFNSYILRKKPLALGGVFFYLSACSMVPRTENPPAAGQPCSAPQALASMEDAYVRRYWQVVELNSGIYRANPRSIVVLFPENRLLVLEDLGGANIAKNRSLTSIKNLRCAKISNQHSGRYVIVGPADGVARDKVKRGAPTDALKRTLSSYAFLYPDKASGASNVRRLTSASSNADAYQIKINAPTLLIEIKDESRAAISDGVRAAIHESVHLFDQGGLWQHDPGGRDGVGSRAYLQKLQHTPEFSDGLKRDMCLARDAIESIREFRDQAIDRMPALTVQKLRDIYSKLTERQRLRATRYDIGSMEAFWEFAEGAPQFLEQNDLVAQKNLQALASSYDYYCNVWSAEIGLFYPLLTGSVKIRIQQEISSFSGYSFDLPEFSESGLRSFEKTFYSRDSLADAEATTPISDFLCLQVGIFRRNDSAESVRDRIEELGFIPVRVKDVDLEGNIAHRVEIGPLVSEEELVQNLEELRALYYGAFRITCSELS